MPLLCTAGHLLRPTAPLQQCWLQQSLGLSVVVATYHLSKSVTQRRDLSAPPLQRYLEEVFILAHADSQEICGMLVIVVLTLWMGFEIF